MAERMPNQAMLIDSLVLQEARASSEIENILTPNDELFKAASDEALPASAEAKEVLRYRQALHHGFRQIASGAAQSIDQPQAVPPPAPSTGYRPGPSAPAFGISQPSAPDWQ